MACHQRPAAYPVTPDNRYFVVRGRLWRCTNPALPTAERQRLTRELMAARAAVRRALRAGGDGDALRLARAAVHATKVALGERGAPWWTDGAPDFNRHLARNTPYRDWFAGLPAVAEGATDDPNVASAPAAQVGESAPSAAA